MEVLTDTVLQFGFRVWQIKPPATSLVIVTKATFDLRHQDPCSLADEQDPCGGDVHHDDDEELSLRYEQDFAVLKPRGECSVVGSVYAPRGAPASELQAGFRIGSVTKGFLVFGDRYWQGGLRSKPSRPVPFTEMPLRRERAFGGPSHKTNPWGLGHKGHAPEPTRQLPNIEQVAAPMTSPRSKPDPVVTSPIPMGSRSRIKLAGTYDNRWVRTRWPYFPKDFNWDFFLAAPEDQRIQGYWRGDEEIVLQHLHRRHARLTTRLPDLCPRVFLYRHPAQSERDFTEANLVLDTITIDTEREKVLCLWRGIAEVGSEELDDLSYLFVTHEDRGARTPPGRLYARFLERLRQEQQEGEEEAPAASEPAPAAAQPAAGVPPASGEAGGEDLYDGISIDWDLEDTLDLPAEQLDAEAADAQLQQLLAGVKQPEPAEMPDRESIRKSLQEAPFESDPALIALLDEPDEDEEPPAPEPVPSPDPSERERFLHMIETGASFVGAVFENADLSCLDLQSEDLTGLILIDCDLTDTNLRSATVADAQLSGCVLVRANCDGARLQDTDLTGCNVDDASFQGADLEGVTANASVLKWCDFRGARCAGASFVEADLVDADFSGAQVYAADFTGAVLEGANFTEAFLKDATFEGSRASQARFDRSNLTNLRAAEGADFAECSLREVTAPGSLWDDSSLREADFTGSDLTGAFFSGAMMFRARLDQCRIRGGTFTKANLSHVTARRADLFEADLEGADLSYADFSGANLFGAEVWKATTEGTLFNLANVSRTKIGVLDR